MDDDDDLDYEERSRIREDILAFSQYDNESLPDAWDRFKEILEDCYGHGLNRHVQAIVFYERLNSDGQHYLDLACGGDFDDIAPDEAYRLMEEECQYAELDPLEKNRVEDELDSIELVEIGNEVKKEPRELLSGDKIDLTTLERSSEDETTPVNDEEVVVAVGLVNPGEETDKGNFDPFVEKRVTTKEELERVTKERKNEEIDLDPVPNECLKEELEEEPRVPIDDEPGESDVSIGVDVKKIKPEELKAYLKIDLDPDPCDESNGKNFNNFSFNDNPRVVVCLLWYRKETKHEYLKKKKGRVRRQWNSVSFLLLFFIFNRTKKWADALLNIFNRLFLLAGLLLLYGLFITVTG